MRGPTGGAVTLMRHRRPAPAFPVGQRVIITAGVLTGIAGRIARTRADGRVELSLDGTYAGVFVRIHRRYVRRDDEGERQRQV